MKTHITLSKSLIFSTLLLFGAGQAKADQEYSFLFSEGQDQGAGTIFTNSNGLATSGSLTVTSGADIGTYNLDAIGPSSTITSDGAFIVDNMVYATQSSQLDYWGLDFTGSSNGTEKDINIWGNMTNSLYSFWSYDETTRSYNVSDSSVSFSLTPITVSNDDVLSAVPEPASLVLMSLGLAGIAFGRRNKIQLAGGRFA
ncbi:MAG: PEP-CTERM sorting domain-containing protein [Methylomonas sp.]|jgi:hypothetical protein